MKNPSELPPFFDRTQQEQELPCPNCGCEVRTAAGYLQCECPDFPNTGRGRACSNCAALTARAEQLEQENRILSLAVPLEDELSARIDEALKYLAMEQGFTLAGIARLLVDVQRRMADDWQQVGSERLKAKQAKEAADAALLVKEQENAKLAEQARATELANEQLRHSVSRLGMLQRERAGEVWLWQGDGEDHPESLTCPVLMQPEHVREFVALKAEVARLTAYVQQKEHEDLSRMDTMGESTDSRTAPASRGDVNNLRNGS